ncbi:MAG TPA: hypothetical protein VFI96_00060, partial [Longimicrobiaceae bacterium]|nr:hypothetical protein [Longimicrobiaceae bacterium]
MIEAGLQPAHDPLHGLLRTDRADARLGAALQEAEHRALGHRCSTPPVGRSERELPPSPPHPQHPSL